MIGTVEGIRQELMEAQAEQFGLNPEKFRGIWAVAWAVVWVAWVAWAVVWVVVWG